MLGGVSGSAYYIATREEPRVEEIQRMIRRHPLLSLEYCSLPVIHTVSPPTFSVVLGVLQDNIPKLADESEMNVRDAKPVKLVVIDTLTDIFDPIKVPGTRLRLIYSSFE